MGTPTGSARIAAHAIVVLPDPPAPNTPSIRPSACSRAASAAAASAIVPTARAAVVERREVGADLGSQLGRRDVRLEPVRRAGRPGVGDQHVDPGVAQPRGREPELVALRVERADDQDGRHQLRYVTVSWPPCSAERSIASQTSAAR